MYLHWNLDSTAAYIKKKNMEKKNYLFSMQLFSADAAIFSIFFSHENIKKTPSKVAHNRPQTFFSSTGPAAQTSPDLHFRFIKKPNPNESLLVSGVVPFVVKTISQFTIHNSHFLVLSFSSIWWMCCLKHKWILQLSTNVKLHNLTYYCDFRTMLTVLFSI